MSRAPKARGILSAPTAPFVYDEAAHRYICAATGEERPHITGMLVRGGLVDDRWFTDEGRIRGTAVHNLLLDFDLDAIEPNDVVAEYKGYVLAYQKARSLLRPTWRWLEEAFMHAEFRFGGRPDRGGYVNLGGLATLAELKSGKPHRSTDVQTALQAILMGPVFRLPPEVIQRLVIYLDPKGRMKVERVEGRTGFAEAYRLIKEYC